MNKFSKKLVVVSFIVFFSFGAGFAASDYLHSLKNSREINGVINTENPGSISRMISEIINIDNTDKTKNTVDFGIFWDAWNVVEDKYKMEPLDYKKMVYGAISGMVSSLGDPYTAFFTPEDNKSFEEDMQGVFEGIGAEIGFKDKILTVIAPLKDSPAEKAGLFSGDKILKVDGRDIFGMSLDEAVALIRGRKGTMVNLLIAREGLSDLKEVDVTRDTIKIKTVEWEMKPNKIVYISISQFKINTANELDGQIDAILSNGPRGIILDLRNNPGGYLEVAIDVASRFIDEGKTVVIEDYGNKKDAHAANGGKRFANIPVVVLVNEGSASASEILAGALKDNNGAKLVGKKTFGKGLVQEMKTLKDGSSIKVTIAKWLTPGGININKNGIAPDYELNFAKEDIDAKKDPQLEKAIEILK